MNKELVHALKELIIQAGALAITKRNSGLKVELKEDGSPVTNADKEISNLIYKKLTELTPDIPIICEEQPVSDIDTSIFWLVDPIDGTRSYIKQESSFTVNIGLVKNNVPTCGFIYQPEAAKLYYTDAQGKLIVEQDGKPLEVADSVISDNYIATVSSHYLNLATRYFLTQHSIIDIVRVPSSIKLCLVAEGVADVYPRFGRTMEWDIAAGHALIRAAGGDIVDTYGKALSYGKPNFENPHFLAFSKNWLKGHGSLKSVLDLKS